ncbi:hypothetical protein WL02_28770 [Burkholderia ubonensis]|nr:hypothetical protein WL02_28770 [Burkholderia ubonensis]
MFYRRCATPHFLLNKYLLQIIQWRNRLFIRIKINALQYESLNTLLIPQQTLTTIMFEFISIVYIESRENILTQKYDWPQPPTELMQHML